MSRWRNCSEEHLATLFVRIHTFSVCLLLAGFALHAPAAQNSTAAHFHQTIQPLLTKYCSDCHMDGMKKGEIAFDELGTDINISTNHDLWFKVLNNTRAGLMPPQKKARPTPEEQNLLERWIKFEAFGIKPADIDPGRVTVRRLNRVEYRNTIRELMGVDFDAEGEFPPDDTGYGFDNIGDVLTVSPMLLEKYISAATTIVQEAVPVVGKTRPEHTISANQFHYTGALAEHDDRGRKGERLSLSY